MRQPDKAIVTVCAAIAGEEGLGSGGTNRANDALQVTLMLRLFNMENIPYGWDTLRSFVSC